MKIGRSRNAKAIYIFSGKQSGSEKSRKDCFFVYVEAIFTRSKDQYFNKMLSRIMEAVDELGLDAGEIVRQGAEAMDVTIR